MTWRPDMAVFAEHVVATIVGPQWAAQFMAWCRDRFVPVRVSNASESVWQDETSWMDWVSRRYDLSPMPKAPTYTTVPYATRLEYGPVDPRHKAAGERMTMTPMHVWGEEDPIMVWEFPDAMPVNLASLA
jgi:hypothetical protein